MHDIMHARMRVCINANRVTTTTALRVYNIMFMHPTWVRVHPNMQLNACVYIYIYTYVLMQMIHAWISCLHVRMLTNNTQRYMYMHTCTHVYNVCGYAFVVARCAFMHAHHCVYLSGLIPTQPALTGNIDALRALVHQKLEVPKECARVKTRFTVKKPDTHGVYAGVFAMKVARSRRAHKKPAAVVASDDLGNGWSVMTLLRKSGAQKGKAYKLYKSPSGKVWDSLKKATAAGFDVS